jgi:hypothetical protein
MMQKKANINAGKKVSLTPSKGGTKHPMHKSAETWKPAGSGSRPVKSKHPIPVSAPRHPQRLDSRHNKKAMT